jgi:predicted naringenin-chalcone synthase
MSIGLIGLGSALPDNWLSQTEFCNHAKNYSDGNDRQNKFLEDLYRRTTISKRSSVLLKDIDNKSKSDYFPTPNDVNDRGPGTAQRMDTYHLYAINLATASSRKAIIDAGIDASEITHLITASCTGFFAPGVDVQLLDSLGLNRDIYRTHIGFMGCHSAMNALRIASSFCKSDPAAKVLLCATEICSIHFQYGSQRNDLIANSLFSDGSAAIILSNQLGKLEYSGSKSYVIPQSEDAITWRIGDHGFAMSLSSNANVLIQEYLPEFIKSWLQKYSLCLNDINGWAIHPGGPRILNAVQDCLKLSSESLETSRKILEDHGNMSSPTALFILERLLQMNVARPYVMLGFGPGLTIEAALFD